MKITTQLVVSSIAGFSAYASTGMFFPIIAVYALSIGADRFMAGLIAGSQTLVTAISMILFGLISDIVGRRKLIVIGLSIYVVAPLLYILADDPWKLLIVRLIHGLGPSTFIPSATAYIVDESGNLGKGYVIGTFTTSTQMGYAIGPLIGGTAYQLLGFQSFLILSAVFPVIGLILFIAKGKGSGTELYTFSGIASVSMGILNDNPEVNRRIYIYILASSTLIFSTLTAAATGLYIIPIIIQDLYGAAAISGTVLFGLFLSSSLVRMPAGYISDVIGRGSLLILGLLIQLAGVMLITLETSITLVTLGSLLIGSGMGISNTISVALISEFSPTSRRGIGMGIGGTSIQLGVAIGPSLAGYLYTFMMIGEILFFLIIIVAIYMLIASSLIYARLRV